MKEPLIVANWKMNPATLQEAEQLFHTIEKGVENIKNVEVVVCPPFLYIPKIQNIKYKIQIGAQDCFWEEEGAFTGEVSPKMLKNMGCSYVILGHSERKKYLGETLEMVNKKVLEALKAKLIPVVCIGEDIEKEMKIVLRGIKNAVLVYEPEWAISTARNAKPETPKRAKKAIERMKKIAGADVQVLYGGSVQSSDIKSFLKEGGAQGALVGAASLDSSEFIKLIHGAIL